MSSYRFMKVFVVQNGVFAVVDMPLCNAREIEFLSNYCELAAMP